MRGAPLLPRGAGAALRRQLVAATAVAAGAAALLMLAALASYAPGDPSWNTAAGGPAANLLGRAGAHFADAALQAFGIAAAVPALALIAWGWRLWRDGRLAGPWLRLSAAVLAMLALPAAAAATVPAAAWPSHAGAGGVVGRFLTAELAALVAPAGLGRWPVVAGCGLAAVALVLAALGLRREEWRRMAAAGALALGQLWQAAAALWAASSELAARRLARGPQVMPASAELPREVVRPAPPRAAGSRRAAARVVGAEAARTGARELAERQGRLELDAGAGFRLPPLGLLAEPDARARALAADDEALAQNARMLETVLADFGVRGEIVRVRQGPVVTRYELEPAPGTRAARVVALADDIARSMSAISVRVAVIPGQNAIGIELPNARREIVYLRLLLGSHDYERAPAELPLALGKDISGAPVIVDLARMPHLLVAGTTGSGKSVAVNSMILSLLYRLAPEQCRLILIDPKMLELSIYDDIPHLLHPVVVDPAKAVTALKWAVKEMNERYRMMSFLNVRNIAGYNRRLAEAARKGERLERTVQTGFDAETGRPLYESQPIDMTPLPFIVVVVDEMADLMLVAGKDIEITIQSLAQKARAAGIHLIIATQRPSVDVITGTIKANLPTRISFQVTSKIDSRTILGEQGAEQLLGMGDMLYMAGGGQVIRVHGPFVSDQEVEEVANFLRAEGEPDYLDAVTEDADDDPPAGPGEGGDDLFDQAVALVARERKASTSFIQRQLSIGYNRAAKIIERMEAEGMVGQANHVGRREVLLPDHGA